MTKLTRTCRAGLVAIGLVAGTSAAIGGATSGLAAASPAQSAAPSAAAAIPPCPSGGVCLWTGSNFTGDRAIYSPVAPGECLEIGDQLTHAYASAYNASLKSVRLWEIAEHTKDGTRCLGRQGIVKPFQAVPRFSFGTAEGLGAVP